jgi:cyclohexyl-isocyanide hydratase
MTLHIGMLLYPGLTQLDLTGPFELMHRIPDAKVHLLWKTRDPITSDSGMTFVPSMTLRECPPLDVVFVPGGDGQVPLMADPEVLGFLRDHGARARYVTSVCTGSLLLGAAGLLKGYQATSHWAFVELLPLFGAVPTDGRVVIDRNRITGGGVTAGIDFGLTLVSEICGEQVAKEIQLGLEYDPAPPFRCGHPSVADAAMVASVKKRLRSLVTGMQARQ